MWRNRGIAPTSGPRLAAGLMVAALTVAAPLAGAPVAAAAAPPSPAVSAHRGEEPLRVSLRINLPDCKACKIKLVKVLNRQGDSWESRWHGVKDGQIGFKLSARHAAGSTFLIKAKWADLYGYQPMVAFHYRGFVDGSLVPRAEARTQKRGTACWAGGHGRESLTVWTGRFAGQTPPGDDATGIRAWVSHTQPKIGPYLAAYKGSVGAQEQVRCGNR